MDTTTKDLSRLATWSEKKLCGKEKPQAMICTIEFNRIVWNKMEYSCIMKAPIKDRKGRVSINIKVDLDPEGTGKHNDCDSSNQMLISDFYFRVDAYGLVSLHELVTVGETK